LESDQALIDEKDQSKIKNEPRIKPDGTGRATFARVDLFYLVAL